MELRQEGGLNVKIKNKIGANKYLSQIYDEYVGSTK